MRIGLMLTGLIFVNLASAATLVRTDVRLYRPFEAAPFQVAPKPEQSLVGVCSKNSQLDNRSDAWACHAGSSRYDPCFVKNDMDKQQVICPQAPWSSNAVMIKLTESLVGENGQQLDMSNDSPWAVQLTDGTRCIQVKDSGEPSQYRCDNHGLLTGKIQRCKPVWKIVYKPNSSAEVSLMDIAVAWF